jgi:flap endonuclease-1
MGVNFKGIISSREIELAELTGKKIAIDAYNTLYQFLSIIRDRVTGEPLKDHNGNITSHLSGILYRTSSMVEVGIKPVYVFDGEPPQFKKSVVEARKEMRKEAKKKWEEALEKGEDAMKYAQAATALTGEMIEDAKKVLDAMGIPWVQAPSEGEAQCAFMCRKNVVDYCGSQDYDSLLFSSPKLVRNLSITGKRKVPNKEMYVEIKPEVIELEKVLEENGINQKQLIMIGMLIGTDYATGVKGVGPKTALKLVKKHKSLDKILENAKWEGDIDAKHVYEFFLNPPVEEKYNIEWKQPDADRLTEVMVGEHDFSEERVEKVIEKLQTAFSSGRQFNLKGFLGK